MSERRVPHRPLKAGIDLSRVGLDITEPRPEAGVDRDRVRTCLRAAAEARLNWVDAGGSADLQAAIGEVVERDGLRPPVLAATIPAPASLPLPRRSVAAEVRAVAQRLRVDCIDLLFADSADGVADGTWRAMREEVAAGRARVAGLRDPTPDALLACHALGGVGVVSVTAGIGHRASIGDTLGWCVSNGIDVIARAQIPHAHSPAVAEALRAAEMRHGNPADVVLVAWILAWPGITAVAFPASTAAEVDRRTDAAQLKLSAADLDVIAAALRANGADDEGFERPTVRG